MKHLAVLFAFLLALAVPAFATQTEVQHKTTATSLNCSNVCPAQTYTIGAGHLLLLEGIATGNGTTQSNIASIVCTPSCGSWVLPGAPAQAYLNGSGGVDSGYVLSSTAGTVSVVVTMTGPTPGLDIDFREVSTTASTGFFFDGVATTTTGNCTSCSAPNLTLNGRDDVVFSGGSPGGGFTAEAAPYGNVDIGGEGSAVGSVLNTTSGTGAVIAQNRSAVSALFTIAFTDVPPPSVILSCTPSTSSTQANPGTVTMLRSVGAGSTSFTTLATGLAPNCAYTDTAVTNGQTYNYEALAVISGQTAAPSNVFTAVIPTVQQAVQAVTNLGGNIIP